MIIDAPQQSQAAQGMLAQLPPRLAFFAGVIITSGIIFAIGFIILVVVMLK